MAVKRSVLG